MNLTTAVLLLSAGAVSAQEGLVERWNAAFIDAIQAESTPPGLAARNLAIFHTAIHDAINSAGNRYDRYLEHGSVATPEGVDIAGVAVAAAHRIATRLYPSRQGRFDELFAKEIAGRRDTEASIAAGRETAGRILRARAGDGSSTTVHYVPDPKPGQWRRTDPGKRPPELPHWPKVTPFCLESSAQFRPAGPPALDSPEYAAALAEVRQLGGRDRTTTKRTGEQSLIARFWADFSYTSSPPGHWNEIAREVTGSGSLDLAETARVFAILNLALADAGIAAFDSKYHYNFWRPVTAIQRADEDGLATTGPDRAWQSCLPSPPHPEYVSAHSTFSGAAAEVLTRLFGKDGVAFEVGSFDVPDVRRRYTNFWDCAEEIGMSRLYGGIHYRFSNRDGLDLGRKIGAMAAKDFLNPLSKEADAK